MFATIAPRYDLVTTLMSYGQDKRWKRKLVVMADVHPYHQILDLACGTGDITFLLARQLDIRGKAIGVDITPEMVERARGKALHEARVHFETGDICQLSLCGCLLRPDHRRLRTAQRSRDPPVAK